MVQRQTTDLPRTLRSICAHGMPSIGKRARPAQILPGTHRSIAQTASPSPACNIKSAVSYRRICFCRNDRMSKKNERKQEEVGSSQSLPPATIVFLSMFLVPNFFPFLMFAFNIYLRSALHGRGKRKQPSPFGEQKADFFSTRKRHIRSINFARGLARKAPCLTAKRVYTVY